MTLWFALPTFAPLLLLLHCLFLFLFNRWLGPIGTFYASLLTFWTIIILLLTELNTLLTYGTYYYVDFGRWFFCLDLIDSHLVFCVDGLALSAALLVLLLTTFALYFGVEYMYREAFINRLLYLLNLFATSVIFLFFCFDFFLILFAWECIGLFSLLLVNFYSTRIYTINAALNTFVFSRVSDMFMFFSFLLTLVVFNTTDLSLIFLQTPFLAFHYLFLGHSGWHFLTCFSVSLVTSGAINAAQFFAHVWLPDAMEAPTPASALIHSSTLVVAGVFLIIRFAILFEFTLFTNYYLILLGSTTLAFGAVTAVFQNDVKNLVAYSTISQIGYLVCGCGFCCYEEVLIYLTIHALNNAFLFVLVGYTVHFFNGNTDMRQMGSAYLYFFDLTCLLFGVCFNLAGLPFSAGFLGNEFLLFQVLRDDFITSFVRGCWMISFFFTPIYMFILIFLVSFGPNNSTLTTYTDIWENVFLNPFGTLLWHLTHEDQLLTRFNLTSFRFQFTLATSRSTTYLLFFFWCFFFFFGESFLLIIFNYNTPVDTIPASHFLFFKFHAIFFLDNTPHLLHEVTFFFILICTLSSFKFLVNLSVVSTSQAYLTNFHLDIAFVCALSFCFGSHFVALSLIWLLLSTLFTSTNPHFH